MVTLLNFLKKDKPKRKAALPGGREALLQALLEARDGLTADQLAGAMGVSRSAVHQHLTSLEREGLVERRRLARTRGRPGLVFALSEAGLEQFPKRYDWFSTLLLGVLSRRLSEPELKDELEALGRSVGAQLKSQAGAAGTLPLAAIAQTMSDLGYVARAHETDTGPEIEAFNCVYHHLAVANPDICAFDLALLEETAGARPEHAECMVRGGGSCRFRFAPQAEEKMR